MAVLVTGCAGFIGSHVTDRLLAEGTQVVGIDNYDSFYSPEIKNRNLERARSHAGFTNIRGDIRSRETLDAIPGDVDAVVHLAAKAGVRPSIEDPMLYESVNVGGTLCLLDWMRSRSVRDLVFASSSSVYGNNEKVPFSEDDPVDRPISPYAATKRAAELLCHTYHHLFGLSVVALRLFTVYGPRQRPDLAVHKFARRMKAGLPIPVYGDGSTERDYTYVDDAVDGIVRALRYVRASAPTFEIVNIGESTTVALARLISVLAEESGIEPEREYLPAQPGDVRRTYADTSKAGELLGYHPRTDLRDGIRSFMEWLAAQDE